MQKNNFCQKSSQKPKKEEKNDIRKLLKISKITPGYVKKSTLSERKNDKVLAEKFNNFFLNKIMNFKYKVTKSTSLQIINCAIHKFLTLEMSSIEART